MNHTRKVKVVFLELTLPYFLLSLVFSFSALRSFDTPFFWISMAWWPLFLHLSLKFRKDFYKIICFNIFLLVLFFGVFELVLSNLSSNIKSPQISKEVEFVSQFNKEIAYRHDVLGYAPTPNNIVTHKEKYSNGESLEVVYTTNKDGLRTTMPNGKKDGDYKTSLIFFGGSFTFGEAVNDNETLPYFVGKKTNWKHKIYNFGFEGYGPHQMLAALEKGIVSNTVSHSPKYIIYQGIMDHINRVVRGHSWIKHGPKYILKDGKPTYVGQFDNGSFDNRSSHNNVLVRQLLKSLVIERLVSGINRKIDSKNDVRLFVSIVEESRNLAKELYPSSDFLVILWGYNEQYYGEYDPDYVLVELRKKGITVLEVRDIIPSYETKSEDYVVPNNGHPNELAYEEIAQYLTTKILE